MHPSPASVSPCDRGLAPGAGGRSLVGTLPALAPSLLAGLLAWTGLATRGSAYQVVAYDTEVVAAAVQPEQDIHVSAIIALTGGPRAVFTVGGLTRLGDSYSLRLPSGAVLLPHGSIDFYETYRVNLGQSAGNVVWLTTGRYLTFRTLAFEEGQVVIGLDRGAEIRLPESVIDFRATVLDGQALTLALGAGAGPSVNRDSPSRLRTVETTLQPTSRVGGSLQPGTAKPGPARTNTRDPMRRAPPRERRSR